MGSVGLRRLRGQDVDCYSMLVKFQLVNSHDNTDECRVQWAVGLEIGRYIDAHSEHVMSSRGGKVQTVL